MDTVEYTNIIYGEANIRQRNSDGYLSATDMCKANNKLYGHWSCLDATKAFLSALSSDTGIPTLQLVQVKKGNSKKFQQGTWIHPQAAIYLAQWISPKFSVKVTKWITEWMAYSADNKDRLHKALVELEPSKSMQRERDIQRRLQEELSGDIEVQTPAGYIDVMTDTKIIEIKCSSNWKHATGQILSYSIYYPDKQKCIYLFDEVKDKDIIKQVCAKYDIYIMYIT